MSDDIKPVLAPEDWERIAWTPRGGKVKGFGYSPNTEVSINHGWPWLGLNVGAEHSNAGLDESWYPVLVAFCNHHLPDDDPRKITQAMVEDIRHAAAEVATYHPGLGRLAAALDRHADMLAALLPPE
jgi:hypothetical protein